MSDNTNNIHPLDQKQLTQTDIDYSVKVSKQVIIKEVKSHIEVISQSIVNQREAMATRLKGVDNELYEQHQEHIRSQFIKAVNADNGIRHLRLAISNLTNAKPLKNMDIVAYHSCRPRADAVFTPLSDAFRDAMRSKHIDVAFHLAAVVPDKVKLQDLMDGDHYGDDVVPTTTLSFSIPISPSMLNWMLEAQKAQGAIDKQIVAIRELRNKLDKIDETMEELEAQLLVNHMSSSKHGRAVLATTTGIVTSIIGDTTPLLADFKE